MNQREKKNIPPYIDKQLWNIIVYFTKIVNVVDRIFLEEFFELLFKSNKNHILDFCEILFEREKRKEKKREEKRVYLIYFFVR